MDSYNDILSIVVDLGFENTKVGYAGDENPTNIFSSNVGIPLDLDIKVKNEIYKKCLCTKGEFYQFNLIYPLFYLEALENAKIKPCLYLDNKCHFNMNEDVFERIMFMNVNGDRSLYKLIEKRVKDFIGNKLQKQSDIIGSEFVDNSAEGGLTREINVGINENDQLNEQMGKEAACTENSQVLYERDDAKSCNALNTIKEVTEIGENCIMEKQRNEADKKDTLNSLKEWAEENDYFDMNVIENKLIDTNSIKNMINKYNNVGCGLNEKMEIFSYLFSLPNKRNKQIKEKITQLLFEKYKVPALYFNSKSILSGLSYNKNICSVVDVGSCYTDFSLCNEGIIDDKNYKIYNIGGSTVDLFLEELLAKFNKEYCTPYFENNHYYKKYEQFRYNKEKIHADYYNIAKYMPLKDLKSYLCEVADSENNINDAKNMTLKESMDVFILPDGQNINISKFKNIACEIFFTPSLLNDTKLVDHLNNVFVKDDKKTDNTFQGLPTTLFNMLKNVKSIKNKDELLSNVILTGSSTLFDHFNQRFIKEFKQLDCMSSCNFQNFQVLNHGKYDKQYSSWKGGSILSSFKNFSSFFVTRKEYEEFGFDIVNRKC
ncbi:actin-like protein [Plasmodium brasilianum]|uniref:Actin-like protein, putative n=2 Tax=Plasmodium (Plasmodium) TaxID=418103 RepID=A0A1A8W165_PLAMA|nr:actin-like protein, putative [Plasmodium malariae]KAI4839767.1 actin-like protein [Plasmodium brasilianum]SBS86511.1 actin-related protein, putative [Plasmodium malariae]SBT86710.1 actin-like protein, putative [Plasmodium malariae]